MEAAPANTGTSSGATLSEREQEILAFERQWWKYAGAKEQAVRELFDMSATRYYQVLNALIDRPEALTFDPMLVKRLRAAPVGGAVQPEGSPLLLPVLSVLVVLGAIGLAGWMLLTAGDGEEETDLPTVTQPSSQPSSQPSDTASSEPTDGDGDKDDSDKKDDDKSGTKGDDKKDDEKSGTKGDDDAQPVPQIPVYVFNQTTISGLAAETASSLESAGWNVVGVDNWVGNVPSDTVYFYPGDRAAAERLSKDFLDIERVWPASAPMPAGALTVILADTARK